MDDARPALARPVHADTRKRHRSGAPPQHAGARERRQSGTGGNRRSAITRRRSDGGHSGATDPRRDERYLRACGSVAAVAVMGSAAWYAKGAAPGDSTSDVRVLREEHTKKAGGRD